MQLPGRSQDYLTIARISGTLMTILMIVYWVSSAQLFANQTTLFPLVTHIFFLIFDCTAIGGFLFTMKDLSKGTNVMYFTIFARALFILLSIVHQPLTITIAIVLGMVSTLAFTRSFQLNVQAPKPELRRRGIAYRSRILGHVLIAMALLGFMMHNIRMFDYIMSHPEYPSRSLSEYIDTFPSMYIYTGLCLVGALIARKKQLAGGALIILASLAFVAEYFGTPHLIHIAIVFLVGGIMHVISFFLFKPKPEPLPEIAE